MKIEDLFNKVIIDIFVSGESVVDGLDYAEIYIKLEDRTLFIFPKGSETIETIEHPPKGSKSILSDLSDIPVYHVNPEGKTMEEVSKAHLKRKQGVLGFVKSILGLQETIPKEYQPYKVEYKKNELIHIKGQAIKHIFALDYEVYVELENGYVLSETRVAPHGIGAGLNYYKSKHRILDDNDGNYRELL